MNLNIGILCSGMLGIKTLLTLESYIKPQFIFTDNKSFEIITYANNNGIPLFLGSPINIDPSPFLKTFCTDVILSINYIFIVNEKVLKHPQKYAINLHGSLLPKYRGRTPHVWAIINGESETGISAHIMELGCDTGDILLQKKISINIDDTGASILEKFEQHYPKIIKELILSIERGSFKREIQNNENATFFGKRTPEDGQINWNWQKERIYNWIRAQAFPYPGAFSIIKGQKVIIDKINYSEFGYSNEMPNGLVLKTRPNILVKTPNGVVGLEKIRNLQTLNIINKDIFESSCN